MADPEDRLDPSELERQRRRHPTERRTSRWSGLLLLLIIPHAAFGYALVALAPDPWVRNVHFMVAPFVLVLGVLLLRAALRIPWGRTRERVLVLLSLLVVLLTVFQLLSGMWMRWGLPGTGSLWIVHIGSGILNTVVVALAHVVAILPSILVSARREHAALTGSRRP